MPLEAPPPQTGQGPSDMPQKKVVTECGHNYKDGRHLVVCIDGTSNRFGKKNTNVIELYNLILKDRKQQTWYNSGIGTYARPSWKSFSYYKRVIYHKIDMVIAWNFERTVLGAYRWLSDNYEDGDCIFLFGFSRGAYQVRVLSAMIDKVGLIYKGNEMQIPFAYELYADPKSDEDESGVKGVGEAESGMNMAKRFKKAFSYKDVQVHFVGAWDTVSSIGIVRGRKLLPGTVEGMKHVCYFRHALALDECRVKFLPEYTYGGTATDTTDKSSEMFWKEDVANVNIQERRQPEHKFSKVKEVWFPGTHSDIGGRTVYDSTMDRSRATLRWMAFEAEEVGLRTAGFKRELPPDPRISRSLTWPWLPLEILPFRRLTFSREKGKGNSFTSKPHLGKSRKIQEGQRIHGSFFDLQRERYSPKARPPKGTEDFWSNLGKCPEWQEFDVDLPMLKTVDDFLANPDPDLTVLENLSKLVASGYGLRRQALYTKIMTTLKDSGVPGKIKYLLVVAAVNIMGKHSSGASPLIPHRWIDIDCLLEGVLGDYDEKVVRDFKLKLMQQRLLHAPFGFASVAFSPDGKLIVSGHSDGTVRLWSMETMEAVEPPLKGHRGVVWSVAFSPDGKHVVSGSADKTVRLWNAETREADGRPLEGHTYAVKSVAFSPDGKHVVSGSHDETVRFWNVETREADGPPLKASTSIVASVAFSPDGKCIVSGSGDGMVHLWNVETREADGTLEGRPYVVTSVAFSPDGKHVVSGSWDHTIRLWNVETRRADGSPLEGHTHSVTSVAFSPDGKHVVSGSLDHTVRLWNVETRQADGSPLEGHISVVCSVAFSPDGNWIASGSMDGTLQLWDRRI